MPSPASSSPPGPDDVRDVADAVLSGVYTGDLAVALERGGRVLPRARHRARRSTPTTSTSSTPTDAGRAMTRGASSLVRTAEELEHAAALWRADRLD